MKKIESVIINQTKSYLSKEILNFWEIFQSAPKLQQTFELVDILGTADNVICMIHEGAINGSNLEQIKNLFSKNVRTYILTTRPENHYRNFSQSCRMHFSRFAVGHYIFIVNKNGTAKLYTAIRQNEYLEIEYDQELYHQFIYAFWNYETRTFSETKNEEYIGDAPTYIQPLSKNSHIGISGYYYNRFNNMFENIIGKASSEVILSYPTDKYSDFIMNVPHKINIAVIHSYKTYTENLIERYNKSGIKMLATQDKYLSYLIVDDQIYLIHTNEDVQMLLPINGKLVKKENLLPNDYFEFIEKSLLGNIRSKQIVISLSAGEPQKRTYSILESDQYIDAIKVSLKNLKDNDFGLEHIYQLGYQDNKYTKSIDFSLTFSPERVSSVAAKDNLYRTWEEQKKNLQTYTQKLLTINEKITNESEQLTLLEEFWSFLTGKRSKVKDHQKTLSKIFNDIEDANYDKAVKLVERLNEINNNLQLDRNEIDDVKEHNRQKTIYLENRKKIEESISKRENKATDLKQNITCNEKEINLITQSIESSKGNKDTLSKLLKSYESIFGKESPMFNLNSYKSRFEKDIYDQNQNMKLKNKEIDEFEKTSINAINQVQRDIDELNKKFEKSINKKNGLLDNLDFLRKANDVSKLEEIESVKSEIKVLESTITDIDKKLKELIKTAEDTKIELSNRKVAVQKEIEEINNNIAQISSRIINLDNEFIDEDFTVVIKIRTDELSSNIKAMNQLIQQNEIKISELKRLNQKNSNEISQLNKEGFNFKNDLIKLSEFRYIRKDNELKRDQALQNISSKKNNNRKNIPQPISDFPKLYDIKNIPEDLPVVGELYSFQNKRFLAINYWDEYDIGLIEANRLKATLVAGKEV